MTTTLITPSQAKWLVDPDWSHVEFELVSGMDFYPYHNAVWNFLNTRLEGDSIIVEGTYIRVYFELEEDSKRFLTQAKNKNWFTLKTKNDLGWTDDEDNFREIGGVYHSKE